MVGEDAIRLTSSYITTPMMKLLWNITWLIFKPLLVVFCRFEIRGAHHLDLVKPPIIVAANHTNRSDPYVIGAAFSYNSPYFPIRYLTAQEYMEMPVLGVIIAVYGGIVVHKGVGKERALKEAVALLKEGQTVGIFPSGKIITDSKVQKGKEGVAYLASKTGLPVVPVAISGSYGLNPLKFFFGGRKIIVSIGAPITTNGGDLREVTAKIMNRIRELHTLST